MTEKLIIGTANFSRGYGIANRRKLSKKTIFEILQLSARSGIFGIDTASAYGDAEDIVGDFITQYSPPFQVITKLPPLAYDDVQTVKEVLNESFKRLRVNCIQYVLLHSFKSYNKYQEVVVPVLQDYQRKKRIDHWGVSVYHPEEILQILKDGWTKFTVEFPINIFDRRFLKSNLLNILKTKGCTLFARSVFLQGLFFLPEEKIGLHFSSVRKKLIKLGHMAKKYNMSVSEIALLFVARHKLLDGIIIGVDSAEQLKSNLISLSQRTQYSQIKKHLQGLEVTEGKIILPYLWPK